MEAVIYYARNGVEKTIIIRSRRIPNFLSVKFAVISKEIAQDPSPPSLEGTGSLGEMLESLGIVITDVRPRLAVRQLKLSPATVPPEFPP